MSGEEAFGEPFAMAEVDGATSPQDGPLAELF
jgi:hypothetical protein